MKVWPWDLPSGHCSFLCSVHHGWQLCKHQHFLDRSVWEGLGRLFTGWPEKRPFRFLVERMLKSVGFQMLLQPLAVSHDSLAFGIWCPWEMKPDKRNVRGEGWPEKEAMLNWVTMGVPANFGHPGWGERD